MNCVSWVRSSWHRRLSENSMPPLLRQVGPGRATRLADQLRARAAAGRYGASATRLSGLLGCPAFGGRRPLLGRAGGLLGGRASGTRRLLGGRASGAGGLLGAGPGGAGGLFGRGPGGAGGLLGGGPSAGRRLLGRGPRRARGLLGRGLCC